MSSRYLTTFGMAAALTILTGCSEQEPQSVGDTLPAPTRSTEEARSVQPSAQDDGVVTPEEAEQSEFAALDTNSNGMLEKTEWDSEQARSLSNLKNMNFAQIDRDASGGIEPDEFSNARTDGDSGTGTAVGGSDADERDPADTGP